MSTEPTRPGEVAALADALQAAGSVRIPLDQLWTLWAAAAPRLVGDPAQAAVLAAALRELAGQGVVELPVTAWDTSTNPPLRPLGHRPGRPATGSQPGMDQVSLATRTRLGRVAARPVRRAAA